METVTPATTRARARHHEFLIDKLPPSGGTDKAPMASEYFLASLASCHITTAHKVAQRRRVDLAAVKVRATAWFDGDLISKIRLEIRTRGALTAEDRDTVFRLTERICTISRATSTPIEHAFLPWA